MNTRSTFEKCLGHEFIVEGFQKDWVELVVGSVTGIEYETIWIEPEYLELVGQG